MIFFLQLYDGFISLFEARLNQIKFAGLVSSIVRTINPQNAIDFVTRILKNRTRIGIDASMCLDMEIVMLNLKVGNVDGAQAMIETAKEQLNSINASESVIFSKYYRALSDYRKVRTCRTLYLHLLFLLMFLLILHDYILYTLSFLYYSYY